MSEDTLTRADKESAADKMATAAFVTGIISIFSSLCCCPFVFSAIGITLALLSKGAKKFLSARAKTGLILSIVGAGVSLVLITITVGFPIFMIKTNPEYRETFIESYENEIESNESLFRQMYGDEVYEEMLDMIENF